MKQTIKVGVHSAAGREAIDKHIHIPSSISSQDSLDDKVEVSDDIPVAPPALIDLESLTREHEVTRRQSQRDLILSARGTLRKKKTNSNRPVGDFEFYVNEYEESTYQNPNLQGDRISLASEEDFAGLKEIKSAQQKSGTKTIRSHRGTVRGVRNRVRAGIATFLRDPSSKVRRTRKKCFLVLEGEWGKLLHVLNVAA